MEARRVMGEHAAIRAGFSRVARAFERKDWKAVKSMVTSDFRQVEPNKKVKNIDQAVAELRRALGPLSELKVKFNVMDIQLTGGNTATVETRYQADGKDGNKNVHVEGSETDRLRKVGGQWKAAYIRVHDESVSVDGRVVEHMP
jgi:ketosteroid isomerase-like protein